MPQVGDIFEDDNDYTIVGSPQHKSKITSNSSDGEEDTGSPTDSHIYLWNPYANSIPA